MGIFMAVFTVVSGIIPLITKWHSKKAVTREPFEGIPGPLQIAFYTVCLHSLCGQHLRSPTA